ncbi:MAG: efflux RND transporter periplasmic adaptor subunit [Burkholderiales bacterium]
MTMNWKRLSIGVGAIVAVAGLGFLAMTRGPLAPTPVTVAAASRAPVEQNVFGIGTVEARFAYSIGPTLAGRVLRMHVDHGDRVKAGQLLAEIDPVDLRDRLMSAEAAVARARHAVRAAEAQAREAASRHQLAESNAARYRELAQRNFVSKEAADVRQNEANVTQAAIDASQASLAAAERDVERLGAEREAIAKQLGNLQLIAPVNALVVARLAEAGTSVVAGQAVVKLVDSGSLWIRARIDQGQAGGLSIGQPAEVVLRSAQGVKHAGRLVRIDIQSDAVTEERIVNIELIDRAHALSIGELAEVTIRQPQVQEALVIPSAAVKRVNREAGVWQVVNGRAKFQAVRLGVRSLDGFTQVLEGLAQGDEVIVHSNALIEDAMRVRIGARG